MTDLVALAKQIVEQNQQLLAVLETLAQVEAVKAQIELENHCDRWVDAKTLAKQLGPKFSDRKILADLQAGLFKYGRDYINVSAGGDRPSLAFKKTRVEEVYKLPPEKRRHWPVEVA